MTARGTLSLMEFTSPPSTITGMSPSPAHDWGAIARSVFFMLLSTTLFAFGARVLYFGVPEPVIALIQRVL